MRSAPDTSLVQVTLDPLEDWKASYRVCQKAKSLGMEVIVGLDRRSKKECREIMSEVAKVIVVDNDTCWIGEQVNEVLDAATRTWAFLVSDDEEPSGALWNFTTKVPPLLNKGKPYIWRPRMLSPLPGWKGHYKPLDTFQPRFFPREEFEYAPGFDELPRSRLPEIDLDFVLWHYTLWSPREFREKKVREHEEAWNRYWHLHPWPPSSRKAYLFEDYPDETEPLGIWEDHKP